MESIEEVRPQYLQEQIDSKEVEANRLQAILAQKIRHTKELRNQLEMVNDNESSMSMRLEQYRALRMSKWWFLSVCVSLFCLAGAFSKGSYFYGMVNFWAFLLVWRGLYVDKNQAPWAVAIALNLWTLKFG